MYRGRLKRAGRAFQTASTVCRIYARLRHILVKPSRRGYNIIPHPFDNMIT